MHHRLTTQKKVSRLALAKRVPDDRAELCDVIAESFRDLSPDIRAAAMNAATAQRAADDFRARLAVLLANGETMAPTVPASVHHADLLDAATREPLVQGYPDAVVEAAYAEHCEAMGEAGLPALTLHEFLPQFRARMLRAARLSETQP